MALIGIALGSVVGFGRQLLLPAGFAESLSADGGSVQNCIGTPNFLAASCTPSETYDHEAGIS
jgi:hypothetical protein